jgi:hypothetical protein
MTISTVMPKTGSIEAKTASVEGKTGCVGRCSRQISAYRKFLSRKVQVSRDFGASVDASELNPILKPHQRDIVRWAVQGGRRAIFAAFGLGKTMMQLEILRLISKNAGGVRGD